MTGVGRYNGSKVRNYRLDEGTPYGHMGGRVINLATDSTAIYAFDNRGSIYLFSTLNDKFNYVTSLAKKIKHDVALNDVYVANQKLILADSQIQSPLRSLRLGYSHVRSLRADHEGRAPQALKAQRRRVILRPRRKRLSSRGYP